MSSEEERQILKMVEDGKISAEEAMRLIKALEETPAVEAAEFIESEPGSSEGRSASPEFEAVKARAQKYAMIPLWVGVGFTVLGAYWMYVLVQSSNYGFWFFCAWFPLLLGLLAVVLSAGGMDSRWLYINVDQRAGEWPQHFTMGFPIPLGIIAWILRTFGNFIPGMNKSNIEDTLAALSMMDDLNEPLIVNVDEGERGDRVQVYIG